MSLPCMSKPTPGLVADALVSLKLPGAADYDPVWANRAGRMFVILTRDRRLACVERVEIAEWVFRGQYGDPGRTPGLAFHHVAISRKTHPDLVAWSLSLVLALTRARKDNESLIMSPLEHVLLRDMVLQQRNLGENDFLSLYSFLSPVLPGTQREALLALLAARSDCPSSLLYSMCLSSSRRVRYAASMNKSCLPEWRAAAALLS